ncbi:hypothetical protein [Propylenella binzhouense]|uniref:Uncharacterized protein n=1 Tax=Propylenella binzhouense TaxID=2555902 RepID=A0A964WS56_9HYPH|nr:hypothetical protein [Propylenella binzhouense]MYZ46609.1 hypothetical protein [Propylenella binzhouense]
MDTRQLRFESMRDLYQTQRDRRDAIRSSVATPVAAFAFSIFDLSTLATHYDVDNLGSVPGILIAAIAICSVATLLYAALLIISVERNFIYIDPPDLEGMVDAEASIRRSTEASDEDETADQMQDLLAGSYDIIYRRYFAANEQAARDRTLGLRLILCALAAIAVAFLILPFQGGGS